MPPVGAEHVSCGIQFHNVTDIYHALLEASQSLYSFIVVPIAHPRFRREFFKTKTQNRNGPFLWPDLLLRGNEWVKVVGEISPWIDVDSPIAEEQRNSEKALDQELSYSAHLCLPAVLISLRNSNCLNLARCVYNKILGAEGHQMNYCVWVHVPMRAPQEETQIFIDSKSENGKEEQTKNKAIDTWEWWNSFRTVCNTDRRVGLALELSADLPNYSEIERWLGEPIKSVFVSTALFTSNKGGFPVLPKAHQNLLKKMFKIGVQVVITGNNRHSEMKHYHQYMDHLWTTQDPDDHMSKFARGFEDYLQIPLQPLSDNLESCTYETFEKDPFKYNEYQVAIYQCLLDKISVEEKETKTAVLLVAGAGRGPLVRAALNAADLSGRKLKIYAVEKNPNAFVTLQHMQETEWQGRVSIVLGDMRDWEAPEKVDILVSELLGSFGDNELSPECLDGAQRFLKEDGVSIPCSYTSYLAPVSAAKVYSEVSAMRETSYKHPQTFFETPFVVHLHNHTMLANPQSLFHFSHPNKEEVRDNARCKKMTFRIPYNCTVHGFVGFFDAVLYKETKLSIHPKTHSPGMFSWFPIFFPIREPVYVNSTDELEIVFWRCVSPRNVWYEWLVSKPSLGTVHNPNGRSYTIGL